MMTPKRARELLCSNPVLAIPLGLAPTIAIDIVVDVNSMISVAIAITGICLANALLDKLRPPARTAYLAKGNGVD